MCPICQDAINPDEEKAFLGCAHGFHDQCLEEYRKAKGCALAKLQCPVCKFSSTPSPEAAIIDITDALAAGQDADVAAGNQPAMAQDGDVAAGDVTAGDPPAVAQDGNRLAGAQGESPPAAAQDEHQPDPPAVAQVGTTPADAEEGHAPAAAVSQVPRSDRVTTGSFFPSVFDQATVFCQGCLNWCQLATCRVLSKKANTWRCKTCSSKVSALGRVMGGWPPAGFKNIPTQEIQQFFRSSVLDGLSAEGMKKSWEE